MLNLSRPNMTPDITKIEAIKTEVDEFLYNMQEVQIVSAEQYTEAGDLLKQVQMKIKRLDDKRKEYTQPLDESKKRIMADFKAITEPLEEFVSGVKSKMLTWAQAEQKRLDEEQKRIEAEALAKAKEENVSEVQVPVVNTATKTQRGEVATTTIKKVWKWEPVDISLTPHEYLAFDGGKIAQAIRDGVREIPGVKIYQDDQIAIR